MSLEKKPYLGSAVLAIAACSADVSTREQASDDPSRLRPAPNETTVSDDIKISMQLSDTAFALQEVLAGLETGRCAVTSLPWEHRVVDQKRMVAECAKADKNYSDIFELTRFLPPDGRSRTAIVQQKQQIGNTLNEFGYVAINFNRGGELAAFTIDPLSPLHSIRRGFHALLQCISDPELPFAFRCGSPIDMLNKYVRSYVDRAGVVASTNQIRDRLDAIFSAAESPDVNRSWLLRQPGSKGHRNR